jgi:transcriptional regulator GlxA family with amidase domain
MTNTRIKTRMVSIVIFDGVEVLDFCGPFEVFAVTGERQNEAPFQVVTVAEEMEPIMARGGLSINPSHTFDSCLHPEIVLVPGGMGTRREMNNQKMLGWLKDRAADAELVLSVCSGSLLLAKAGLLDGLSATTHHGAFEELRGVSSRFEIDNSKRFIDNGRVIVSAGISAGIDMSLYVVARLLGKEQALETATYMEYEWSSET